MAIVGRRITLCYTLTGIVHFVAQDGNGAAAATTDFATDTKQVMGSALALVQGIVDADAVPEKGLWLVTPRCSGSGT